MRFARRDLRASQELLRVGLHHDACYHAQQAAEKAMKAVILHQGVTFPRTHDLDLLFTILPSDAAAAKTGVDMTALGRWAVEARYPGLGGDPSAADAEHAIRDARRVVLAAAVDTGC